MANNKVELADGTVLMDLTGDTVTPSKLVYGATAHDSSGTQITGTGLYAGSDSDGGDASNAKLVNGHTVLSDVPANAVFSNTHRAMQVNGTAILGGDSSILPLNLVSGKNVSLTSIGNGGVSIKAVENLEFETFTVAGGNSYTISFPTGRHYGALIMLSWNRDSRDIVLYAVSGTSGAVGISRVLNATSVSISTGTRTMTLSVSGTDTIYCILTKYVL